MKINILFYLVVFLSLFIALKIYKDSDEFKLKCVISDVNGKRYCVRDKENLDESADLLAKITDKLVLLVDHVYEKYPDRENVKRMKQKFNPKKIRETLPTSEYTAYSENKGEKIAFCLNKKKGGKELIDENTLTFVAIHELGHVMTESIGHTEEFWKNFKFLLENAVEKQLYVAVNYEEQPAEYCSMEINDNPLYNID